MFVSLRTKRYPANKSILTPTSCLQLPFLTIWSNVLINIFMVHSDTHTHTHTHTHTYIYIYIYIKFTLFIEKRGFVFMIYK